MALKVREEENVSRLVYAEERMWRTEDDRLVADGEPGAVQLFAAEGQQIDRADAVRYGLVKPTSEEKQAATADAAAGETADAVEGQTVEEVLAAVGDDPALAQAALDAENASAKPRKTLVAKLEQVAGGAGG